MAQWRIRTTLLWLLLACIGPHVVAGFHMSMLWKVARGARRTLRPSTVRVNVRSSPIMERDVLREEEEGQASGAIMIEDVEDFLVDSGLSSDAAQEEEKEDENFTSTLEERLKQFGALTDDGRVDLSSRTLKALQAAQEEGRAAIAKASESVRTFGAYAVSRAVADTELVMRVTVVVASELSSRITPMLLPAARASEPAPGEVKLTLKEKIELAALGIYQPPAQSQFLLRSFSSAGDKEALMEDMYRKVQRGRGPILPEKLGALRIPLKIAASLPALPVGLLKTANKVYELGKEASDRSASRQVIKAFKALPVASAARSLDKLLSPPSRWNRPIVPSLQAPTPRADPAASLKADGNADPRVEAAEEEAWESMEGVRGGADGPVVAGWGNGISFNRPSEDVHATVMASASATASWPMEEEIMNEMMRNIETTEEEDEAPTVQVVKMKGAEENSVGQGQRQMKMHRTGPERRRRGEESRSPLWSANGGSVEVYAAEDEAVIDTRVEAVADGQGRASEEPIVVVVLLKMVDVLLLGMEKVVLEVLPLALGTLIVAGRRVEEVMTGPTGRRGWELLSSFDKPMRSQGGGT